MKQSDIDQAERILQMIRLLTEEELSSVEIVNDNPDGSPDCAIGTEFYAGTIDPVADTEGMISKTFWGDTLASCLEQALNDRGLQLPQIVEPA